MNFVHLEKDNLVLSFILWLLHTYKYYAVWN